MYVVSKVAIDKVINFIYCLLIMFGELHSLCFKDYKQFNSHADGGIRILRLGRFAFWWLLFQRKLDWMTAVLVAVYRF